MRRHRKLLFFIIIVLVVVVAVGSVVYYRIARPARAVLLLPDGDLMVYANLAPVPFVNVGQFIDVDQLPGQSDPEYRDFLRQTNFHAERDLESIAVSIRNPGDSNSEFAAIFTGKFDQDGLRTYMQRHSTGSESYAGKSIFSIQGADHLVRACVLDSKTVAVTNIASADSMHSIIDKAERSNPGEAPPLIRDYYHYVPFGSFAWAMMHVPAQTSQVPAAMKMDFLQNAVAVISVRYTGSVRVRAEIISANLDDAAKVLEACNTFLAFSKVAAGSLSASQPDKDLKAVFDNIQVEQKENRTILSVVVPQEVLKKVGSRINQIGPRSD